MLFTNSLRMSLTTQMALEKLFSFRIGLEEEATDISKVVRCPSMFVQILDMCNLKEYNDFLTTPDILIRSIPTSSHWPSKVQMCNEQPQDVPWTEVIAFIPRDEKTKMLIGERTVSRPSCIAGRLIEPGEEVRLPARVGGDGRAALRAGARARQPVGPADTRRPKRTGGGTDRRTDRWSARTREDRRRRLSTASPSAALEEN
ncbi:hypothetical protein I79_009346 [Cricetulus griseus]|uniref:Uncharacterized protein n=1 Tax=Cricetulus griseus TaxID=10029 RepID=G3HFI8_CRIGR|nr:hypothetical protein I79_009346 [Cricetulus griseus]